MLRYSHEAYLRLVASNYQTHWDSRGHFFAAAAEAMRRILIEAARRKGRIKHGGGRTRESDLEIASPEKSDKLLALDEALERLSATNAQAAELVKLRYFAGFSNEQAASLLRISPRKANQIWAYARAWLREALDA